MLAQPLVGEGERAAPVPIPPRRSRVGQPHGARDDRRVRRLPVPVLLARRRHARASPRRLRRAEAPRRVRSTSRSRSTRTRNRAPRPPRRCARSAATPRSGRSTSSPTTINRTSIRRATRRGRSGRASTLPPFRSAMDTHKFLAKVDDDMEVAKTLGVNGTPDFFINGVELSGAQPAEKFHEVDRRADRARAGEARERRHRARALHRHGDGELQSARPRAAATTTRPRPTRPPCGRCPSARARDSDRRPRS